MKKTVFPTVILALLFVVNVFTSGSHPAQAATDSSKIKSTTVRYKIDDQEFANYLVYDDSIKTPRPGVLIAPEFWGISDFERNYADRLAAQGYTVMVIDLYGGGFSTKDPAEAKKRMDAAEANSKTLGARFMRAYEELEQHQTVKHSDIGAIGFGFGGGLVIDQSRSGVTLKAAIDYYGGLVSPLEKKAGKRKVHPEIRVFVGEDDTFVNKEQIEAFKKEMLQAKAKAKVVVFPNTLHSFARPDADEMQKKYELPFAYNAKSEKSAWEETLSLFKAKLKVESSHTLDRAKDSHSSVQ